MEDPGFDAVYNATDHTLVLSGSVDELAVDELRSVLSAALDAAPERELLIDLNRVEFLPSLALGVLVGARSQCYEVRLEADQGTIAFRILKITGLLGAPGQEDV